MAEPLWAVHSAWQLMTVVTYRSFWIRGRRTGLHTFMATSDQAATRARPTSGFLEEIDVDVRVHPEGIAQAAGLTRAFPPIFPLCRR
jgi:hypothetical protein